MRILFFVLAVLLFGLDSSGQQLQGTITDHSSGEPLPGATVLIPDLKQAVITDADGHYHFDLLSKGKYLLQVRMIGYAAITEVVDLSLSDRFDFKLNQSIIEKNEVVITGSSFTGDRKRTSLSILPIERSQLLNGAPDNLMQSLATIPGVSTISSGAGISKPVIRGLGFNRVVIINRGIRQEGQQWGSEHGPELDPFSADRIELLKGPASLQYGSDAIGGIINIPEPIPPPVGELKGVLNSQFASNNQQTGNSLLLEGNEKGFVWSARGSYRSAGPYHTPKETVYNSGYTENAQEVMAGMNRRWGYSHVYASRWYSTIGLTEGERDSSTGKFTGPDGTILSETLLNERSPTLPVQHIEHTKISNTSNYLFGDNRIRLNVGLQQNDRKEFVTDFSAPGIFMVLRTLSGDLRYHRTSKDDHETTLGISGQLQANMNRGNEYLIPDYRALDAGIFGIHKWNSPSGTVDIGLRFDQRHLQLDALSVNGIPMFSSAEKYFNALSGSIGFTHTLNSSITLKSNVGRGFRAPTASELSANGIHEGTFRYEIGNLQLKPEISWEWNGGFILEREKLSLSIDLFAGTIQNYIYYEQQPGADTIIDSKRYPVYQYIQVEALRGGGELSLDLHPIETLHFENSISIVYAQNQSAKKPLPFTPPVRSCHELRWDLPSSENRFLNTSYTKISFTNVLPQRRIDDVFETSTKGYLLIDFTIGTTLRIRSSTFQIHAQCNNLTNTVYFDHLSRYKDIGVTGIGRSFAFGIECPFNSSQRKSTHNSNKISN